MFLFFIGLLAAPPEDENFESAPLFFCRKGVAQTWCGKFV